MHTLRVQLPDPLLIEAYEQAAGRNVLAAINHNVFYGHWSVCADGEAFGGDTTFPGLDWGQSAEALLWLDQVDVVKANWAYVRRFQRSDGLLPFAICPSQAGQRSETLAQMHSGDDHVEPGNTHVNERLVLKGWNYHATRSIASTPS